MPLGWVGLTALATYQGSPHFGQGWRTRPLHWQTDQPMSSRRQLVRRILMPYGFWSRLSSASSSWTRASVSDARLALGVGTAVAESW